MHPKYLPLYHQKMRGYFGIHKTFKGLFWIGSHLGFKIIEQKFLYFFGSWNWNLKVCATIYFESMEKVTLNRFGYLEFV